MRMTAKKRFTLAYADYDWWAICDKENPTELGISGEEVVKLLNEQHEELGNRKRIIKTITNEYNELEQAKNSLLKENEQLKHDATVLIQVNRDYRIENEQLKHELHTLTGLYAFDKLGDGVKASDNVITIPREDLIKLDYGDV